MNWKKGLVYTALAIATGYGTFRDNQGLAPLFNEYDTKNSAGGIRIGIINRNSGTFKGLSIGIENDTVPINSSKIKGIELAVIGNEIEGLWDSPETLKKESIIYGLQASLLVNRATAGSRGLQVGLYNLVTDKNGRTVHWNPIFNVMNGYEPEGSK